VIPDILHSAKQEFSICGTRAEFRECDHNGKMNDVWLHVKPGQPWLMYQMMSHIHLEDADGNRLCMISPYFDPNKAEFTMRLTFFERQGFDKGPPTGQPARLVWDVPAKTQDVEVPFEFDDLPMDVWGGTSAGHTKPR